ncbi:MAG: hypothetical protein MJZ81_07265 [Bacteroidales bacterium]|nr:hypothetical protein [Bacteroidales bacterium]
MELAMTSLPKRLWTGCEPYRFTNDGSSEVQDFTQDDVKWTNVFAEGDNGTTLTTDHVNAFFANCTTWLTMLDLGYYPGSIETGKSFASECDNVLFWWQQRGIEGTSKGKSFWPYRVFVSDRKTGEGATPSVSTVTDLKAAAVAEKTLWGLDSVLPSESTSVLVQQGFFMTEGPGDSRISPGNGWCSPKISIRAYDGSELSSGTHASENVEVWAKVSPGGDDETFSPSDSPESIDEGAGYKVLLYSKGVERCFQFPVSKGQRITVYTKYIAEEAFEFETIDISVIFRGTVI